jgi:hypothetical protein
MLELPVENVISKIDLILNKANLNPFI